MENNIIETQIFNQLFEIVNFFNNPKNDQNILKRLNVKYDANLLPVIIRVGKQQSISVGTLANQLGKSHSSTSRQIDKFIKQGLLIEQVNENDNRIKEIQLSELGEKLFTDINNAREELMKQIFKGVSVPEMEEIISSLNLIIKKIKRLSN